MTDRELMQQALEALERCRGEDLYWMGEPEFFKQAITALRERLAQPEQEPRREWTHLTWKEIDECFKITPDQYLSAHIYKRIFNKLKEKNNG